jgi:ubiquinone/menaquinone biosynthesis C-methylase UbiE
MNPWPADAAKLYTNRQRSYLRFVNLLFYPQGIRAFFCASPLLRSGLRILDAGCGTGIITLALREALVARGLEAGLLNGFDLTPAMLDAFRATLRAQSIDGIELVQADVLELDALPSEWTGYDLIVSASMMEYLPRARIADALAGLRGRLNDGGSLLLFITRQNLLMESLIGRWWDANLYRQSELRDAFGRAGFGRVEFRRFPLAFRHLDLWGHVVEASG